MGKRAEKMKGNAIIVKEFNNNRNPVLPLECHIPDGEAHVMSDGKLYIYGSFDNRENEYCSDRYHVVSSPDMKHWTIHDESFNSRDVSWFADPSAPKYPGLDWIHPTPFLKKMVERIMQEYKGDADAAASMANAKKEPMLFAPDCIEKDGKYYLYFCMNDESEGVAVSDVPEGPFCNAVRLPCGGIDPAVFIDDDGQAYYYWGQVCSHGVKLNPDMVSFDPAQTVDLLSEEKHFFHEGSSMRRIGKTYYYVFADVERGKPTALGYATGDSPLGPFTYRGIIIDNVMCDPASWNNHGSIECVNGQWYVFYHRCSRGTEQHRRLCIEPIEIQPDGTIAEVKMTSQGAGEPFAPNECIMGYQACELKGTVYIDTDKEFGEKLVQISKGDEMVFRYVKSKTAYTGIEITASGTGTIEILMNGKMAGTVRIVDATQLDTEICMQSGEYELLFRVAESENLELMQVKLNVESPNNREGEESI